VRETFEFSVVLGEMYNVPADFQDSLIRLYRKIVRVFTSQSVDFGFIPSPSETKIIKVGIHSFPA